MKFIKYYSLEIYTFFSLLLITISAIFVTPDITRQIILAYILLFVLHEWEEGHYPGGFIDMVAGVMLGGADNVTIETKKGSRFFTGIYLFALTLIPYFAHSYTWLVLPAAFLGLWEGIIHIVGIKIFQRKVPYTPGMITAECELILSLFVFYYLAHSGLATPLQYLISFILMVLGFMCMQRSLVHSVGKRYRDLPAMMKANLRRMKESKQNL